MKKKILYSWVCLASLALPFTPPLAASLSLTSTLIEEEHEVVILGGGIGGLTSAIYLGRSGLKPLVIEGPQPGGQILQSSGIQNWPGEKEIAGMLLTDKTREQAQESGALFLQAEAVKVDFSGSLFTITLRDPWHPGEQKIIRAKTCIIATGALPNQLHVPGEETFWTSGVHTCATCDGSLYKGRHVAVVGGGDGAIVEAHHLAKLASKVTLIVRGKALKSIEEKRKQNLLSLPNVEVFYESEVQEIQGENGHISRLVLKNQDPKKNSTIPIDAVFLAIGTKPNTALFRGQLELDERGYVVLKKDQGTSRPGVFAIGDVSDPHYRQAITAAGDGAKAALQVENFLAGASSQAPKQRVISAVKSGALTDIHSESQVIVIRSIEQFHREVLESPVPVIVDFYADWCGPCRSLHPHFEAWAKQFQGKMKFVKINVEYQQKLAQRYRITALPTVLYFEKDGLLTESRVGAKEIGELMTKLESRIKAKS